MFPEAWEVKPLGELVAFLDHMRVPVKEADREKRHGPYPYYGANGQIDWIDGYIFDEPLVLLAEDGGFFGSKEHPVAYKIEGKAWVNNHAHVLRPDPNLIDIDYLHWFLSFRDVGPFLSGSTRVKLTKSDASRIPIVFPKSLDAQRRIAETIERADDLKKKREQASQLTNKIIQSVFLKMFGDPVRNPRGWEIRQLGAVARKIVDGTHRTPNYVDNGIPFLTIRNMVKGEFDLTGVKHITEREHREFIGRCRPEKGDILYSKDGTLGVAKAIDIDLEFSIFVTLALIKPDRAIVNSLYLENALNSEPLRTKALEFAKGMALRHLHLEDIKRITVPIPPMELQDRFASRMHQINTLRQRQRDSSNKIYELFRSLMHKAFKGELAA